MMDFLWLVSRAQRAKERRHNQQSSITPVLYWPLWTSVDSGRQEGTYRGARHIQQSTSPESLSSLRPDSVPLHSLKKVYRHSYTRDKNMFLIINAPLFYNFAFRRYTTLYCTLYSNNWLFAPCNITLASIWIKYEDSRALEYAPLSFDLTCLPDATCISGAESKPTSRAWDW